VSALDFRCPEPNRPPSVEEVSTKSGSLRWTRTALKWTRTSDIPVSEITAIRAISPWQGDNKVEVNTTRKQRRIGGRLLRHQASELAKHLRDAVGKRDSC